MASAGRPLKVDSELEYLDSYINQNDLKGIKKLIEKHGVDCYDPDKRTFLINAASMGNIKVLQFVIDCGANIDFQDKIGYSALHFAAQNRLIEITDLLIEKGANVNVRDIHGNSPIWTAIFNAKDDFTIVKKLYKAGADIETKNKHDKSPKDFGETVYKDKFMQLINE